MTPRMLRLTAAIVLVFALQPAAFSQQTWEAQESETTETLYRVQFLDADAGYVAGNNGTVLKTTDGGGSWTDISVATDHPLRDLSFVDQELGWVVSGDPNAASGSGAVWKTSDGGASWTQQSLGTTQARLGVSFVSATHGWACGSSTGNWDIRATSDGGDTWAMQTGNGFGWLYDIDFVSQANGWAVGVVYWPTNTGFIVRTTNGGGSWNQLALGTIPFLNAIDFAGADIGMAAGEQGTVRITGDGGDSWTTPSDLPTDAALFDVAVLDGSRAWVCGAGGVIFASSDGGDTWTADESGTSEPLRGIFFLDETTGWAVGDNGTILATAAGAAPVIDVTLTPPGEPIVIPAAGGSFAFDLLVTNTLAQPRVGQLWIDAILPNGNVFLVAEEPVIFQPGQDIAIEGYEQLVPGFAPPGEYTYRLSAGRRGLNLVVDSDSFPFTKQAGGMSAR
ncbi:MAG: Ycf48-like protein [Calditrichaeota bacterium]|nr:Ycf48-like protein [Calditrichota bacterium]